MEHFPPETLKSRGSLDQYEVVVQIGEGTYGRVYKAIRKATRTIVALKIIPISAKLDDGVTFTAIREIKNLLALQKSRNVVDLIDSFFSKENELVLVLEYFDYDLSGLLSISGPCFSLVQVKYYMKQVLESLHQCHANGLMHRDMKAANLLLNSAGYLKIADLGLMTSFDLRLPHSNNVVTLWYRAPELLLGIEQYGPAVDLWSAGCILIELFTKKSPFPGLNESHQLDLITRVCGTPSEDNFAGVSAAPGFRFLPPGNTPRQLAHVFRHLPADALDLLERLLTLDPRQRIKTQEALRHPFFADAPDAPPAKLCQYESVHEFEVKRKRKLDQQRPLDAQTQTHPTTQTLAGDKRARSSPPGGSLSAAVAPATAATAATAAARPPACPRAHGLMPRPASVSPNNISPPRLDASNPAAPASASGSCGSFSGSCGKPTPPAARSPQQQSLSRSPAVVRPSPVPPRSPATTATSAAATTAAPRRPLALSAASASANANGARGGAVNPYLMAPKRKADVLAN